MHYIFHYELPRCIFQVSLSFLLKAAPAHSSDSFLFWKMPIIGQLNVPTAAAENEEQYTLSNIIYIGFQNSFLWIFF